MTYRSQVNKQVVSRLVREMKGLNPEFKTDYIDGIKLQVKSLFFPYIIGAAYTYYTSCCASESAACRGVTALKLTQKRCHERLSRVSYTVICTCTCTFSVYSSFFVLSTVECCYLIPLLCVPMQDSKCIVLVRLVTLVVVASNPTFFL